MIVISMSDFLKSPAQYVERAKHTAVMLEGSDVTLSRTKPRQLGALEGQMKLEWVGDGKVTPAELFETKERPLGSLRDKGNVTFR